MPGDYGQVFRRLLDFPLGGIIDCGIDDDRVPVIDGGLAIPAPLPRRGSAGNAIPAPEFGRGMKCSRASLSLGPNPK
jgi:hypothetical protein